MNATLGRDPGLRLFGRQAFAKPDTPPNGWRSGGRADVGVAIARAAGYDDLVGPPMFVVVYSSPAIEPAMFDEEIGIVFDHLVHGAQEFAWNRVLVAGEEVHTTITLDEVRTLEAANVTYYVFGAETTDSHGAGDRRLDQHRPGRGMSTDPKTDASGAGGAGGTESMWESRQ